MTEPLEIKVESDTYDFYWALEEIAPPAVVYDLTIRFLYCGLDVEESFQLATRGYYDVQDDKIRRILDESREGKLEEILLRKEVTIDCIYEREDGERAFEPPRNAEEKPNFTQIYHPAQQITIPVIEEAVQKYMTTFYGITQTKITIVGHIPRDELEKAYANHLKTTEEMREAKKNGTLRVTFGPQVLEVMWGIRQEDYEKEIKHGYYKDDALFLEFKDGTTRYIRKRDDEQ